MQVVYYTIDIKFMIKELKLLATFLNAKQVLLYLIGKKEKDEEEEEKRRGREEK